MSRSNSRKPENEESYKFWERKIQQWQFSDFSQAEFCRREGLKANAFSYWKNRIRLKSANSKSEKLNLQPKQPGKPARSTFCNNSPAFIRFPLPEANDPGANRAQGLKTADAMSQQPPVMIAEIIDDTDARRLRIFSGADQATVKSLVAQFCQR
jgi:hypothetical protein